MPRKLNTSPPPTHLHDDSTPSSATDHSKALNAIRRRYQKKASSIGMAKDWVDDKAMEDVEVIRKEYLRTGKGEPTDEWLIWFFEVEDYVGFDEYEPKRVM